MARRTIFIRPRLQVKYLISSLLVVCLTALAVYYVFWSSLITSPGLDALSSGEMRALQYAYQTSFVWVVLIILVAIGFLSIFYFHRLVGPLYVLGKIIKALAAGDLTAAMHTRKHDELKDLATETEEMIGALRAAVTADREHLALARAALEKGDTAAAREHLSPVTAWFKV